MGRFVTKTEIVSLIKKLCIEQSPYCLELAKEPDFKIYDDTCLVDLGINSIDYTEISTIIMEELDVEINLTSLAQINKIEDIANIVYEHINQEQSSLLPC